MNSTPETASGHGYNPGDRVRVKEGRSSWEATWVRPSNSGAGGVVKDASGNLTVVALSQLSRV